MVLTTQRTIITPVQLEDINEVLEMYKEPDSFKYIAPHKNKSVEYYTEFLDDKIKNNKHEVGFWCVRNKETNEFIGTVNLNKFLSLQINHIGCHLKTEYWGQGFAKELCSALLEFGFNQRKLTEIHGIVEEGNMISTRLMNSLGFKMKERKEIEGSKLNIFQKLK